MEEHCYTERKRESQWMGLELLPEMVKQRRGGRETSGRAKFSVQTRRKLKRQYCHWWFSFLARLGY